MDNLRLKWILGITLVLLLIPFIGTLISDQVNWGFFDFIIMGAMLIVLGLTINLVSIYVSRSKYKVLMITGSLACFLLLWAEMAVGIFGSFLAGS